MATMWRGGRMMTTCLSQLLKGALDSSVSRTSTSVVTQLTRCSAAEIPTLGSLPSGLHFNRGFGALGDSAGSGPPDGQYISLNNLRDNPGATKTVSFRTNFNQKACFKLPTATVTVSIFFSPK